MNTRCKSTMPLNLKVAMPKKKKPEHYVNNSDFLQAIIVYKREVTTAESLGLPKPMISNYIGECFLKMANHLAYKPNFVNYMFKEDMICDGIENCIQCVTNFNPEKSTNPFAYFTQVIYYAFLRRIQKEKKQLEIKSKIIERSGFDEVFSIDDLTGDDGSIYNSIKDNIHNKLNR